MPGLSTIPVMFSLSGTRQQPACTASKLYQNGLPIHMRHFFNFIIPKRILTLSYIQSVNPLQLLYSSFTCRRSTLTRLPTLPGVHMLHSSRNRGRTGFSSTNRLTWWHVLCTSCTFTKKCSISFRKISNVLKL